MGYLMAAVVIAVSVYSSASAIQDPLGFFAAEKASGNNEVPEGPPDIFEETGPEDIFEETFTDLKASSSSSHWVRHQRAIHRDLSPLTINLVSFYEPNDQRVKRGAQSGSFKEWLQNHHPAGSGNQQGKNTKRTKRATYHTFSQTWPRRIPYMFDSNYDDALKLKVRRIMNEIQDHVCVEWIEEPNFDPNNNTYETNSYLNFVGTSSYICGTVLGRGSGSGARNIKTCTSFYTITHELLHTLGVVHAQQGPHSMSHLSVAKDNVRDGFYSGTYKFHNNPDLVDTAEFDPSSIMMYSRRSFTKNGLDVMLPYTEDEFNLNYGRRTNLGNPFDELNQVYNCQEFCNPLQDCDKGYYTRVKGVCTCVCPDGFDPATNCSSLEDETSGPSVWPDVPFTLYAAPLGVCPDGFSQAQINISGVDPTMFWGDPFFATGVTTNYHMCSRNNGSETNMDMDQLPMGTYCVVKPIETECNGGFYEGSYKVTATAPINTHGNYGDWEINGQEVTMKFCCRWDREWYYTMELPRNKPFRLISDNGQCTMIKGMSMAIGRIGMWLDNPSRHDSYPQNWINPEYIIHNFCTYTPPVYGCNEDVTLDSAQRNITIKTPGYDANARTPNKRCLYNFNVPEGARVRVTIDTYDKESNDNFIVRRFNKWAMPMLNFDQHYKKQFLSTKDFLFLEWWSGQSTSSKKGVQFTAEVLLAEDNCYDVADKGRKYSGTKTVSEDFEPCRPWGEAAKCTDFPFHAVASIDLMSDSNFCRNPDGEMHRPWCYVSTDNGMCRRAYCDVCNNLDDSDQLDNCEDLMDEDPTFCSNALQRFKCAQSCELGVTAPTSSSFKCSAPAVPTDGTQTEAPKAEYDVGEFVGFTCNDRPEDPPTQIACSTNGWPLLTSACSDCPAGGMPYGDRCFAFDMNATFINHADTFCKAWGDGLFTIHDINDHDVLREFKSNLPGGTAFSNWVNIKRHNGNWMLYDDLTTPAPYLDWASGSDLNDPDKECAVMVYEDENSGNAGKFWTADCALSTSRVFCEVALSTSETCTDKHPGCVSALNNDPYFCDHIQTYPVVSKYCERSCGVCSGNASVECQGTNGTTYSLTSPSDVAQVGEVISFECNAGMYLAQGDLARTCGPDGQFLGSEPNCSYTPQPVNLGMSAVQQRGDTTPTNKAILFDHEDFKIPFDGVIKSWHFYGESVGPVSFIVFRVDNSKSTGMYNAIGHNTASVVEVNEKWTYPVPDWDQMHVQEGDMYGYFTIAGLISATKCDGKDDEFMPLKAQFANDIDDLTASHQSFTETICILPSIGLTLEPYT